MGVLDRVRILAPLPILEFVMMYDDFRFMTYPDGMLIVLYNNSDKPYWSWRYVGKVTDSIETILKDFEEFKKSC